MKLKREFEGSKFSGRNQDPYLASAMETGAKDPSLSLPSIQGM